ncbi:4Fe-4S binding protein [Candidatus Woesearchaeota archaeon]|nr:4Fe-4S binding protein [Candidatus Woesearchaeota archaeon]
MSADSKKPGWKDLPDGGKILKPGNSKEYKTGDWRTFRPVWDKSKCNHCMICWMICPDSCILTEDGKRKETDLNYCKGCGICAEICPMKCIEMKKESESE